MVDVQGVKEVSRDRVCDESDAGWVFVGALGDFLAGDAAEGVLTSNDGEQALRGGTEV